jgi:Legionella pneumophila major outer membrane protein precursor
MDVCVMKTVRLACFATMAFAATSFAFAQNEAIRPGRPLQPLFPEPPRGSISAQYAQAASADPVMTSPPWPQSMLNNAFSGYWGDIPWAATAGRIYAGADYLLLRAHFSEAIAFVQVTDSLQNGLPHEQSQAQELNFSYNSAFRTYLGYHLSPVSDLQFTYLHINTSVAVNGTSSSPAQFNIDAFGDRAGFGQSIQTNANVQLNAFDFDYVKPFVLNQGCFGVRASAGVRLADVRQSYGSNTFDALGGVIGQGAFATHFFGAGPHLGLQAQARRRPDSSFSLIARGAGSILVGGYDISSGAVFTGVGGASQAASHTLTVPVIEAELGAAWQPTPSFTLSAGWMFQAWFDLGVSGGTNGGKYIEVDDSNIMSFDGLFTRAMWRY